MQLSRDTCSKVHAGAWHGRHVSRAGVQSTSTTAPSEPCRRAQAPTRPAIISLRQRGAPSRSCFHTYSRSERSLSADDAEGQRLQPQPESRGCLVKSGPREPRARHQRDPEANPRVSTAVGAWAPSSAWGPLMYISCKKIALGCEKSRVFSV